MWTSVLKLPIQPKNRPGGQRKQGHRVFRHVLGEGYQVTITFWSGTSQVPLGVNPKSKLPIGFIVFDEPELIVLVIQGLSPSTASLVYE